MAPSYRLLMFRASFQGIKAAYDTSPHIAIELAHELSLHLIFAKFTRSGSLSKLERISRIMACTS
jgi:hypothetical protein